MAVYTDFKPLLLLLVFLIPTNGEQQIDKVHMVFMNHLDVGYDGIYPEVGFINNILNKYFLEYFPRAIALAQELRAGGFVENFVYTTHPWLVSLYLDCPDLVLNNVTLMCPNSTQRADFEAAVRRGDITWHAGPMNMQPENMNQRLFAMSVNISFGLDAMFGFRRSFPVLSQRDVPGLSVAAVPTLAAMGVKAVSVGVNPGTSPPAVPTPSVWRFQGSDVIALWHPGGYPLNPGQSPAQAGGLSRKDCVEWQGLPEVLCFAFRTDNSGPPVNVQEILLNFDILRGQFPGAKLVASTLDDFVQSLWSVKDVLPVTSAEVGDTWIQGIASDPLKMAQYRAFSSQLDACFQGDLCSEDDPRMKSAVRYLVKLPEHTWGLPDVGDTVNWSNPLFYKVRGNSNYQNCSRAWDEQRSFVQQALAALASHPLAALVQAELRTLTPALPDLSDYKQVLPMDQKFACGNGLVISFEVDGSISSLVDTASRKSWAWVDNPLARFTYNTYNETDFDAMARQYDYYGGAGYDKPNSTKNAHPQTLAWGLQMAALFQKQGGDACDLLLRLEVGNSEAWQWYGAPRDVWIQYHPHNRSAFVKGFDVTVQWFSKPATRLAESLSLEFYPVPQTQAQWRLSKMGQLVDPYSVILNGSQYVHAVDTGVFYIDGQGNGLQLRSLDVPLVLVSTVTRPPSPFPVPLQPLQAGEITGMAFNLYNNIWNTNYILWYPYRQEDQDFKARFAIDIRNQPV